MAKSKGVSLVISPWTCSLRSATSGSMETTSSTRDATSELDEEKGHAIQPNSICETVTVQTVTTHELVTERAAFSSSKASVL